MQILQDGVLAALSAVGLAALLWLLAGVILRPRRRGTIETLAVIPVRGTAENLEYTVWALTHPLREEDGFARIVILDCGLTEAAEKSARLLCRREGDVTLCRREELLPLIESK